MDLVHEVHLWNYARNDENKTFVRSLGVDPAHRVLEPDVTGWGAAYKYYSEEGDFDPACLNFKKNDFVITKADDDIAFIDTAKFGSFAAYVATHRDMFLVHANVVNNGVAAHYQYAQLPEDLKRQVPSEMMEYPPSGACGKLWSSGDAAAKLLTVFLHNPEHFHWESNEHDGQCLQFQAPGVDLGQGRFSVNFFGVRADQLTDALRFVKENRDDEHALTTYATAHGKRECIFSAMNVVHLGFYP
eukprot:SRR837773.16783.p2 GENE.SRR837773.16783~~SRR837773.16783.p2  ORF type:complete len:269 (-),score=63.83 SRR837773.16783:54-785(-)